MSCIFFEGFDNLSTSTMFQAGWYDTGAGSVNASGVGAVTNLYSAGNYYLMGQNAGFCNKGFQNTTSFVFGAHVFFSSIDGNYTFIKFTDGNSNQIELKTNSDYTISVTRNGTLLGQSSLKVAAQRWIFFELKCTINSSSGSVILKADNVQFLNLTSINTQNSSNNYVNRIWLYAPAGNYGGREIGYDDMYFFDQSGSTNNDFIGECRVYLTGASGAGSTTQWTPSTGSNYTCIDENPINNDTDYVSSATSGNIDLYNFTDYTGTGTVFAAQLAITARKDDSGIRTVVPQCKSGGTTFSKTALNLSSGYFINRVLFETDPNTSAQWTQTNINSAEFGIKVG